MLTLPDKHGFNASIRLGHFFAMVTICLNATAFGQTSLDFSNQGALDLNTPQRFKPVVGVEMGGIFLSRGAPDNYDFVFDGSGNVLLNANQLQGDMGGGLDTTLSLLNFFSDSQAIDVQMRFFQVGDMSASETVTATPVIPFFFQGIPANPADTYDFNVESLVRSFESNLVVRTPYRVRMLAGFRFFEVDENFDIIDVAASSATVINGFRSRTENTMAGGQVGVEGTILSNGHSRVFGSFKWALLNNDVVGTASASDVSGNPLQADARDSITSQLLDFQLGGSLSFSRWFSLYAGYQGLVASDLALAFDQSRNASIFAGSSNPVFTSDAQWHGFKITGMATW
jgi:hypothetical protein